MKILNKKGFVLVETLIVTLFVVTLFMLVYQNIVPLTAEYNTMSNYDDVESVYATNLFKQSLIKYGNFTYIDNYLTSNTYLDITDCNDTNIYTNSEYCTKLKTALNILEDDYIFITKYDISSFRATVDINEFFSSGKLSNFKSYVDTIGDSDSFYDSSVSDYVGNYRIFLTRTVTNSDDTSSVKYTNLGIYSGKYRRYNMGDTVTFNPGDGDRTFYVLYDSPTTSSTVTLILDSNISSNVTFNDRGTISSPSSVLSLLKTVTMYWTNANSLTGTTYNFNNQYTIDYTGYYARLLEPSDIYNALGSSIDTDYFNKNTLFSISMDLSNLSYLYSNLSTDESYWMANMVYGNDEMAWTISNSKIIPNYVDATNVGIRPVIVVSKDKLG